MAGPLLQLAIYRDQQHPECWIQVPIMDMVDRIMDAARGVAGDQPDARVYLLENPTPGRLAQRVGEIVVQPVQDAAVYAVQELKPGADNPAVLDLTGQSDLRRTPPGEPGQWVAIAVIFDKQVHDLGAARTWIAQHPSYDDLGVEEEAGAYKFPQYSPDLFTYYKQVAVAPGITVVYGMIAAPDVPPSNTTEKLAAARQRYAALHALNRRIAAQGITLVERRAVRKADDAEAEEERFVLGIVLEPTLLEDGVTLPDTQGDVYTAATIRQAAHAWLAEGGQVDLMHSWDPLGKQQVQVYESYLAPQDLTIGDVPVRAGTWLVGLHVLDDALWAACKAGTLGAYSIGGSAQRVPLDETATEDA